MERQGETKRDQERQWERKEIDSDEGTKRWRRQPKRHKDGNREDIKKK